MKGKWYASENWEKLLLLAMCFIGFFEFAILTGVAFWIRDRLYSLTVTFFFILVCLAITGMLLRKGMKYQITARGVSVEYDDDNEREGGTP